MAETPERMLKWFEPDPALPLRPIGADLARHFQAVAGVIVLNIEPGPERTVSLRKLLEARDAAVRAALHPGG